MIFDPDAEGQTPTGLRRVLITIGHRKVDRIRIATHRKQKQKAEQGQYEPQPPADRAEARSTI